MPVKLADYLAKPFSPSVEGVPLQCELRQLARLQHGGRRLDVAARDALAFSVDVIVASMFALRGIARGVLFFARLAGKRPPSVRRAPPPANLCIAPRRGRDCAPSA